MDEPIKINEKDKLREYDEIFELSLCQNYKDINRNMDTIISEIYDGEELSSVNDKIESEKRKTRDLKTQTTINLLSQTIHDETDGNQCFTAFRKKERPSAVRISIR